MLDRTIPWKDHSLPNPRAVIGGNQPPSLIELAKPTIAELGKFLSDYPVITNETESRAAKEIHDRVATTLKSIEDERDAKVRPLNEQVKEINADDHQFHNADPKAKKPGLWDTLMRELRIRLTRYATAEEAARQAALAAAKRVLEEAEAKARAADQAAREAAANAAQGICDEDFASAAAAADASFARFQQADRAVLRAERDTKVRLVGGNANALSLRNVETLIVTDWKLAIEAIGINDDPDEPFRLPKELADMLCKLARTYRSAFGELPPGVTATHERRL
jgi:hypothetical protein